jgi:hypothetical protein
MVEKPLSSYGEQMNRLETSSGNQHPSESKVMAKHNVPEYRHVVEDMLQGKRTKNRFQEPVEVGDTVVFFSARPLYPPHDALENTPDDNPIIAVVHVSKVESGPGNGYPYFIHWDALSSASY